MQLDALVQATDVSVEEGEPAGLAASSSVHLEPSHNAANGASSGKAKVLGTPLEPTATQSLGVGQARPRKSPLGSVGLGAASITHLAPARPAARAMGAVMIPAVTMAAMVTSTKIRRMPTPFWRNPTEAPRDVP